MCKAIRKLLCCNSKTLFFPRSRIKSVNQDISEFKINISENAISLTFSKTLSDAADVQDEVQTDDKRMDQAEVALGDHVTGGVVQRWRQVQRRLGEVLSEGEDPG